MPVMNGVVAVKKLRELEKEGIIDLSNSQILMHSAI